MYGCEHLAVADGLQACIRAVDTDNGNATHVDIILLERLDDTQRHCIVVRNDAVNFRHIQSVCQHDCHLLHRLCAVIAAVNRLLCRICGNACSLKRPDCAFRALGRMNQALSALEQQVIDVVLALLLKICGQCFALIGTGHVLIRADIDMGFIQH